MSENTNDRSDQTAPSAHPTNAYDSERIETKWQDRWELEHVWNADEKPGQKKYYVLSMFPYPSGRLHMGHVRNYTIGDVIVRFRKAQGYNVLSPMGWDAFGLPAENAAIKHKLHPQKWTLDNVETMKKQLKRVGFGYDWRREVTTCLPEYYRWEQLIFTEMFNRGLAYKKASTVNWCPSCATVLANEQVEDGRCWRCESETTTKELEQWFLKTTQYAQELLDDLDRLPGWPDRIRSMQRHWIGRSEGAEIRFQLENGKHLDVFTTRPDTLFGVTYMAIAPEHPLTLELCRGKPTEKDVRAFVDKCRKQDKVARTAEDAEKEGVFTGGYALHPLTGAKVPVFVANFVLMDYGTGALMAVPAHDARDHAFAKKYRLEIKEVVKPSAAQGGPLKDVKPVSEAPFTEPGVMINSGAFDGMDSERGKTAVIAELTKKNAGKQAVNFKMRDWGLSRQRYWGAPIPIIYCAQCGTLPVPKEQLPVVLPVDVDFTGEGVSPLAKHPDFLKTKCPKCGSGDARRETDTMDTFMESSWYYLRYTSPGYDAGPFKPENAAYWLQVDQYIGGVEHATMHLLYFRFFHKVLRDMGYLPKNMPKDALDEPVANLFNQGIVYKDGAKMSKSKGNVVEPDAIIKEYGADTARLFSMFAAPPEKVLEWSEAGVEGSFRFLNRIWRLVEKHESILKIAPYASKHAELKIDASKALRAKTHQTIQKVTQDFDHGYHFNTAIAAIMELVNEIYLYPVQFGVDESRAVLRESIETVLRLLHPFAPHVTEELWERLGGAQMLAGMPLPTEDPEAIKKDVVTVVVQVNGKLRGDVAVGVQLEQEKVVALAKEHPKVSGHLEGKAIVKTIFVPGKLVNFVVK
ncbi:MAG: leucine--tRNA ligase [Bacteriovoracia bacterium]